MSGGSLTNAPRQLCQGALRPVQEAGHAELARRVGGEGVSSSESTRKLHRAGIGHARHDPRRRGGSHRDECHDVDHPEAGAAGRVFADIEERDGDLGYGPGRLLDVSTAESEDGPVVPRVSVDIKQARPRGGHDGLEG